MNKRIKELAVEAGLILPTPNGFDRTDPTNAEKRFAELLVKECLSHVKDRHLCDEIRNSLGIVDEAER